MMKKLVATLFFLSLFLAAAALVAPGFIDWSQHKDGIIAQIKPYLGRNIEVGGQVKFRLVPNPKILLEDVTLSNAEGAKADHFMKLRQLEASMKFQPLLQGRFEVEAINLEEPELDLETLDDGSNNWTGILKERQEGASGLANAADTVQFNQITMTNGTLHYLNQVTGAEVQLDKLNLTVSADTLFGPYHVSGDMQYKGSQVSVNVATGKFGGGDVPLTVALTPVENLPQVKLDGSMDTSGGLAVKGNLSVSQGNVASLFDSDFVKNIAFLNDETDLSGTLDLKGGQAALSDIKVKFGRKGELSGSVSVAFEKGKKPAVTADLAGSNLKVTSKSGFMALPDGFDAHLKLKGKNIAWDGVSLPGATLAADTDKDGWTIKSGRFDLPGKSVVKISGTATPKTKYASYNIQANTEDLPLLLKALPLDDNNFLKTVADSGLVKKLDWSSSFDLRPDKMSFSDIDARIADKMKVSGVLDVPLGVQAPAYKATLNLDDADMSVFADDAWKSFSAAALKADGSVEISAKNLAKDDLKLSDFSLAGETGSAGLHIKDMSGTFADGGDFKVNGTIAALNPAAGLDIEYNLKTQTPGAVAKALGVNLPPPMKANAPADIHGHVAGDGAKYTFNVDGHGMHLAGSAQTGADGVETYQSTVHVEQEGGVLAALGVPVDRLVGTLKEVSGELSGTRGNYKISKLDADGVTGWIARKDEKYSGELAGTTIDFDNWLSDAWSVKDPISLKLSAKKLIWRNDEVSSPAATLDADANGLTVDLTAGQIWGGDLTAQAAGHHKGDVWNGSLKGGLKNADLSKLVALMEFKGFSVGSGDLDFDLTSDDAKQEKEWFHGVRGSIDLKAHELTVKDFAPSAMSDMLTSYKGKPEDVRAEAEKALGSGDTRYDDVDAAFKVADGNIDIDRLKLKDAGASVDVRGAWDIGPDTYHVTAGVKLASPDDAPSFNVNRSGPLKDAPDYAVDAGPLLEYLAQRAPKEQPKAPPVTPPSEAQPVLKPGEQAPPPPAAEEQKPAEQKAEQGPPKPPETPSTPASAAGEQKPAQPAAEEAPAETPQPPALPTPADTGGNGGRVDVPIDTETLPAPPAPPAPPLPPIPPSVTVPPPAPAAPAPAPAPEQPPPAKSPANPAIKGILERLDDNTSQQVPADTAKPAPDAPPPEDDMKKP